MPTKKEVAASSEALQALKDAFPQEASYQRTILPRISFKAQDVMEGKGKAKKVVTEAGTFFRETQSDEKDEKGKTIWDKEELGDNVSLQIVFTRKKLSYYDQPSEVFTSSPEYDSEDDIVVLFAGGKKICEGLPKDLKALPQFKEEVGGKVRSKLKEQRVLYVLYNDELHQLTIRGSGMDAFFTYLQATAVPAVVTNINSEEKENGSIKWNQMLFTAERDLTEEEAQAVIATIGEIKQGIEDQKAFYADSGVGDASAVTTVEALPPGDDDEDF